MNRLLICFILFCGIFNAQANDLILKEARDNFRKSVKDEALCKKYYESLKSNAKSDTEKGYAAAFQMLMAKHTGNPIKKMSYFKGGKSLLEKELKANPNNIELRFIRLNIQYHSPSFLGYKSNIGEDKDFLLKNLYKLHDKDAKNVLLKYLEGTKIYTKEELLLLARDK